MKMTHEHWVQTVAIVVAIVLASIPGIWWLANDIAAVRAEAISQYALVAAKQAADEERLGAIEKLEAGHHTDDIAFQSEMRAAISTVISNLADVRVAVGAQRHAR